MITITFSDESRMGSPLKRMHYRGYPSTHIHSEGYPIDTHPNKIIFEIYWNLQVSPGVLMFGHSKAGKEMIEEAKLSGMAPN